MKTTQFNDNQLSPSTRHILKNVLIGLIFIVSGGVMLGNRIGFVPDYFYHIYFSWQTLLIGIGAVMLVSKKSLVPGIILIVIGIIFLAPRLFVFPFDTAHLFLPALLIFIGLMMIIKNNSGKYHREHRFESRFSKDFISTKSDYISEKFVFGGANMSVESQNFKGGKFSAVFGGGKLDLSRAQLSPDSVNVLDVELIFGGIELIVPRDWNLKIEATSIFGGFSKKGNGISESTIDVSKTLIIRGTAVFGGGEIKRV